jgi:hypothetical protein
LVTRIKYTITKAAKAAMSVQSNIFSDITEQEPRPPLLREYLFEPCHELCLGYSSNNLIHDLPILKEQ